MSPARMFENAVTLAVGRANRAIDQDCQQINANSIAAGQFNSGGRLKRIVRAVRHRALELAEVVASHFDALPKKDRPNGRAIATREVRGFIDGASHYWRAQSGSGDANAALQRLSDEAYVEVLRVLELNLASSKTPEAAGWRKMAGELVKEHLATLVGLVIILLLAVLLALFPQLVPLIDKARAFVKSVTG